MSSDIGDTLSSRPANGDIHLFCSPNAQYAPKLVHYIKANQSSECMLHSSVITTSCKYEEAVGK
eukprot:6341-Heterococcus_DN1.PRE.2